MRTWLCWLLCLTGCGDDKAPARAPDAGFPRRVNGFDGGTLDRCFPGLAARGGPNYAQFSPTIGHHCDGTNHQDIAGVEKVVFLGDSITEGTPPTPVAGYYRNLLAASLRAKLGAQIEISECAKFGARTDDLLLEPHMEAKVCIPGPIEPKRTLFIMTIGGNDMSAVVQAGIAGAPVMEVLRQTQEAVDLMRDAVRWLKDPARFPNGSFVVFANIYEYTDATGDADICPLAARGGFGMPYPEGRAAYLLINEQYMSIAVETRSDMLFMLENFCGHGFHAKDPGNVCYRGPGANTWFDLTCIHPNPEGHAAIADMFLNVVNE